MINHVLLMGRLTRDPTLTTTAGGVHVCNFSVAINEAVKNGQAPKTIFVDVSIWKKQAETLVAYKRKGDLLFIDGKLNLSEWTDRQTHQKRSKLTVNAFMIQYLDGAPPERGNAAPVGTPSEQIGPEDWS